MKTVVIVGLAALVGGAMGALVTLSVSTLGLGNAQGANVARPRVMVDESGDKEAEAEPQDDATQRLRTLEHRVALLSRALTSRADDSQDLKDALEEESLLPEGAQDVADPVFEAAVLDIVDREQERKEEERESYRKELQVERSRRTAGTLAQTLGLSTAEQDRVAQAVTDYFDAFRALRDSPERPVTQREWMEKADEMRKGMEEQLAQIMSPAQFRAYQDLEPEDQIGFGPGRGDRGASRGRDSGSSEERGRGQDPEAKP